MIKLEINNLGHRARSCTKLFMVQSPWFTVRGFERPYLEAARRYFFRIRNTIYACPYGLGASANKCDKELRMCMSKQTGLRTHAWKHNHTCAGTYLHMCARSQSRTCRYVNTHAIVFARTVVVVLLYT